MSDTRSGTKFFIEVQPKIPSVLSHLEDLANNLLYSWDKQVRRLFFRLDRELWNHVQHNPKLFLRRVDQRKLEEAASDPVYMQDYLTVIANYHSYLGTGINPVCSEYIEQDSDLISYACLEFGLHESLPIYSGGLGILAGDHCKAASDLGLPFVAFGILYRQGYFSQQIDSDGNQVAHYIPCKLSDLPISPVHNAQGEKILIDIELPGRSVSLKLWQAKVGNITLYLLDSDLVGNTPEDRSITYQLYGGDHHYRLLQEMVLGIGSVRAHRLLGLQPTVWHINEGHAAFQIVERCRELVTSQGLDFYTALEQVASSTVFTTHTPVPAGHDVFDGAMIERHFSSIVAQMGISMAEFLQLGKSPSSEHGFNMTSFALRGSRFHNGVSKIHGGKAAEMERYVWPDIAPKENPIRHVTNGVHLATFLDREWAYNFDQHFGGGGWRNELLNPEYWQAIHTIPNHRFWSIRQAIKTHMLESVRERAIRQHRRNGISESQIRRFIRYIDPKKTDILTIGFARRFATYKRATLIFSDPAKLSRLVNNPERPVVLIFAGKAHPNDQPGQDLIRKVHYYACQPEFEGKVILLEDYDMELARKLVAGVDVWLNNPIYPLEASGTSGQKAGINGVLNLSVLDGWWDEGYNGQNGWAITPHDQRFSAECRDREEGSELLELLEHDVIPMYYDRNGQGYSSRWITMSKNAMQSLIPRFTSQRMVMDYVKGFYSPASKQGRRLSVNGSAKAVALSQWKRKVIEAWPGVRLERLDKPQKRIYRDQSFEISLAVELSGLSPEDVVIDCLLGEERENGEFNCQNYLTLNYQRQQDDGRYLFNLHINLSKPGFQCYMLRIYPFHELLNQRFETGRMLWL